MKKWINDKILRSLCAAAVLAAEAVLLLDLLRVYQGSETPPVLAAVLWLGLTVLLAACRIRKRHLWAAALVLPALLGVLVGSGWVCWKTFSANAGYAFPDAGKIQIYGNRRVMLVVPHQDDDLNILGGVLEEYARYGSELYPVFVTNGDYAGLAQTRYREALAVFEQLDVPAEHVIFLGYGDGWKETGPHLYNSDPGVVQESYFGRRKTYGTAEHPAYREGRAYTIDNLTEDLKGVILEYRPDVIVCSDYDHHIDHRAVTLLFDKVMGQLLKENPGYTPGVYKAYAYGTAWEAEPDYYADNVLSTKNPFSEPYSQKPAVYRWEDRVRLPVNGFTLSRSLLGSEGYKLLNRYESQGAGQKAASVINGDRVVWRRHTDSLCLHAEVEASSGQAERLNDFMLIENHNLTDESHQPYDGIWIPAAEDREKTATVTLTHRSDISSIVLYDHPSPEQNVLNAVICLDDGTELETGPLDPGGAATAVSVNRKNVTSFTVTVMETEGDLAGLSELEAFAEEPRQDGSFIKLIDRDGNFLYDYWTEPDGTAELYLYTHGGLPELTAQNYSVNTAWDAGTVVLEDGVIRLVCPVGEQIALSVTCSTAGVSDNIVVRNPGRFERLWTELWQTVEEELFIRYSAAEQKKLLVFSLPEKISYVIRHLR